MNAKEMLEIVSKVWCDTADLMKLSGFGITYTSKLKKEIRDELISQGKRLPKGLVPMKEVIDKLNIDVDYYRKLAEFQLKEQIVKTVL